MVKFIYVVYKFLNVFTYIYMYIDDAFKSI